jgi:lipoate-protein ligase B
MRRCELRELGRIEYGEAWAFQRMLVERRAAGDIPDQLLIVEHPHTITLGRNGRMEHLLADVETLRRAGVSFHATDRGGDITYHGPGQMVGYPIVDLREWKRDVVAYVRALEEAIIGALGELGVGAVRVPGLTGAWVEGKKVAAIGVHIRRWITSHGWALNVSTDLSYFRHIVPCGLAQPVTSLRELGCPVSWADAAAALARQFGRVFGCEIIPAAIEETEKALWSMS